MDITENRINYEFDMYSKDSRQVRVCLDCNRIIQSSDLCNSCAAYRIIQAIRKCEKKAIEITVDYLFENIEDFGKYINTSRECYHDNE